MKKSEVLSNNIYDVNYWAKKFDTHAHICHETEHKTLCGTYSALLGNNYENEIEDVCPKCIEIYIKNRSFIANSRPFIANNLSVGRGITIFEEALLRFMVALSPRYHNPIDCAQDAKDLAVAYMKTISDD